MCNVLGVKRGFIVVVLLLGLLLCLPVTACAAKINVSPTSSPPGSEVVVNGQGFSRNEQVGMFFDSTQLMTAIVNDAGKLQKIKLPVPSDAYPGLHVIKVVGQESSRSAQADISVNTNWIQYGFDSMNSGFNSTENILAPANVSTLQKSGFRFNSHARVPVPPVIVDGTMYVGTTLGPTNEGVLQAVDSSGKLLWLAKIKGGSVTGLAFSDGRLVAISNDGFIRAFKAKNGGLLWSKKALNVTGGEEIVASSPVITAGVVYFSSDTEGVGQILAYKLQNGAKLWVDRFKMSTSSYIPTLIGQPIVTDGGLIFYVYAKYSCYSFGACREYIVYNVNPRDGYIRWGKKLPTYAYINGISAIGGKVVLAGGHPNTYFDPNYGFGYLAVIDAFDGKVFWEHREKKSALYMEPSVSGSTIYTSNGLVLSAFDILSGQSVWAIGISTADASRQLNQKPIVANGVVYINEARLASGLGSLWMLDAGNGQFLRELGEVNSDLPPLVVNGKVYTTSYFGLTEAWAISPNK